jgi:uncharacterized protein
MKQPWLKNAGLKATGLKATGLAPCWRRLSQLGQLGTRLGMVLGLVGVTICLNLGIATPALATGARDVPLLDPSNPAWVIDQAEVLSPLSQGKLDRQLSNLAKETGQQLRLVSIRRLDYEQTPATFAEQLFARWFPTPEEQTDQALLVLDTVTNGAAIRAGSGAAERLTPAIAESVAKESMRIPLKENNYNQAFLAATDRLEAVLSGRPDPGPPEVKEVITAESTFTTAEETNDTNATVIVVVLLIVASVVPMATYFWYQKS